MIDRDMPETVKIQDDNISEAVEGVEPVGVTEDPVDADAVAEKTEERSGTDDSEVDAVDEWQVTIDNLNREIVSLKSKAEESRDAMLRTIAEMDNLKKRMARETENQRKYAVENYLRDMLPILDSMELGLQASDDQNTDKEAMCEGMKMTVALFGSFIEGLGAIAVCPEGEDFDPERHEAIAVQDDAGQPKGRVLTVVQKGYMLHDRLIRPAKVVVSR